MAERIDCKAQSKSKTISAGEKSELEGRAEYLKKSLNAGRYGMTGQVDSWQYDPFVMYSCTIGNEFEMLMLIETLELSGIHCVSANTDGLTVFYPEHLDTLFHKLCDEWEKTIKLPIVKGEMQGRLEYTEYERLVQEHVNCYIATKKGSTKPKVKGRFAHEVPLNKNNTKDITRIQRIAIQNYFNKGIPVETTIRECKDIMLFCFGFKSRAYEFTAVGKDGKQEPLGHLLRCYASTSGVKLTKVKEEEDGDGVGIMKILKDSLATPYNYHIDRPFEERQVNYDWYIQYTMDVIRNIEAAKYTGGMKKAKKSIVVSKNQQSLF